MIYLDSSAIVKLVREEPESDALHTLLSDDDAPPLFTSQLAITETKRALHAAGLAETAEYVASTRPPAVLVPGHQILALPITAELATKAGDLRPGSALRSLDAIHLASAMNAEDELTAIITYDKRMADAAASLNLPVITPSDPKR